MSGARTLSGLGYAAASTTKELINVSKYLGIFVAGLGLAGVAIDVLGVAAVGLVGLLGAGLGLAFLGAGVAAAAMSAQVKSAFKDVKTQVTDVIKATSGPVNNVVADLLHSFGNTVASLKPQIAGTFAAIAPVLANFGGQAIGAFKVMAEGAQHAFQTVAPLVNVLGQHLVPLMHAFGEAGHNALGVLAHDTTGFSQFLTLLEHMIVGLGSWLGAMVNIGVKALPLVSHGLDVFYGGLVRFTNLVGGFGLTILGSFGKALGAVGHDFMAGLGAVIPAVTASLNTLLPAVARLSGSVFPALATVIKGLLPVLTDIVVTLSDALRPALPLIASAMSNVAGEVGVLFQSLKPLLPILTQLAVWITRVTNNLLAAFVPLVAAIVAQLTPGLNNILPKILLLAQVIGTQLAHAAVTVTPGMTALAHSISEFLIAAGPLLPIIGQLSGLMTAAFAQALNLAALGLAKVIELLRPLAPYIVGVVGAIYLLSKAWTLWNLVMQQSPVVRWLTLLLILIGLITQTHGWVRVLVVGITALVAIITVWTAVQWLLNTALFATAAAILANPLTWIVVAIVAVVAAVVALWINWDKVWNLISHHKAIAIVVGLLALPITAMVLLVGAVKMLWLHWNEIWTAVRDFFVRIVNDIVTFAQRMWHDVSTFVSRLYTDVTRFFSRMWADVSGFAVRIWHDVTGFFTRMWQDTSGFATRIWRDVTGFFSRMWTDVSRWASRIWSDVSGFFSRLWRDVTGWVTRLVTDVVGFFVRWQVRLFGIEAAIFRDITGFFARIWSDVTGWVSRLVRDVIGFYTRLWSDVTGLVTRLWRDEVRGFQNIWRDVSGWVTRLWHDVVGFVTRMWSDVIGWVTRLWHDFVNIVKRLWGDVTGVFASLWDGLTRGALAFVGGIDRIWSGLKRIFAVPINFVINTVYNDGIRTVWNAIASIVPGIGPLGPVHGITGFDRGGGLGGYSSRDNRLATLADGEHVLTAEEVQAAGGHGAVAAWRAAMVGHPVRAMGDGSGGYIFGGGALGGALDLGKKALGAGLGIVKNVGGLILPDVVGDAVHALAGLARGAMAGVAGPILNGVISLLGKLIPGNSPLEKSAVGMSHTMVDRVMDWIRGDDAAFASAAGDFSGPLGGAVGDIIAVMGKWRGRWGVSSTTGGGHAKGSLHYSGNAVDFVGDLTGIARYWDQYSGSLLEQIYSGDGGHFVKNGKRVPASFYAAVLAEHFNHVHIGATHDAMQRILNPGAGFAGSGGGGPLRAMVQAAANARGWGAQFGALDFIISHESSWNPAAKNPGSTASGLFQLLYGAGFSPQQQITNGLNYIAGRYGNPNNAAAFWKSHGWYQNGTSFVPNDGLAFLHRGERVVTAADNKGSHGGDSFAITFDIKVSGGDGASIANEVHKQIEGQMTGLVDRLRAGKR